ncbi:MAG: Ig-like domain-containing protein [Erysipelotrichaceae bacterium]|nr:Ig-like domain-containing protein [Erysipelotrichaceae bacterium]
MKKHFSLLLILLAILLCFAGCTKKEEEPSTSYDLAGKTYYNTVDEYGHDDHAKVWFGKDGSFVLSDSDSEGYYDISGKWTLNENVCTLDVESTAKGGFTRILFEVEDDDTLILKTSLMGSKSDQTFSTTETKGSTVTPEPQPEPEKEPEVKNVPCTGLKSLYHNYWAIEGTKPWNLEITASPSDTTDKITYKSNDESVVTVDEEGNVSALKPGKTTIDISCGEQKLSVGFETRAKSVKASEVKLGSNKMIMPLGGRETIEASVLPENTTDKTLSFKSSDTSVAKVDSEGTIYPQRPGTCKVEVTAASGVSATVDVCIEGAYLETDMKDGQSLKGGSGDIIYFEVYKLKCKDWKVTTEDLRMAADIHVSDTSLLSFDNKGRLIADGAAVSSTKDVTVYFSYEDEDLFPEVSTKKYTVHITP